MAKKSFFCVLKCYKILQEKKSSSWQEGVVFFFGN